MLAAPTYSLPIDDTDRADPLGTGAVIEMFYRSVFPGINNVVEFVRVYSAICWMVRRIEETGRATPGVDMHNLSNTGLEKIQLLLTWFNRMNDVKGLAGTNRQFPTDNRRIRLSFDAIQTERVANLRRANPEAQVTDQGIHYLQAVQYGPSLVGGIALIKENKQAKGTYTLTTAGTRLADAYDSAIRPSAWYDWLADPQLVTTCSAEVAQMGDMLDLRSPSAQEREVFARAYYPQTHDDETGARVEQRRNGITLALRALEAEQAGVTGEMTHGVDLDAIRYTMARGVTLRGVPFALERLQTVHGWWMNVQIREVIRLALDVLSRNVASWIHDAVVDGYPSREIGACAAALGERMERALPQALRPTVGAFVAELEGLLGGAETFFEAGLGVPALRIEEVLTCLMRVSNFKQRSAEESEALVQAYKALVFCAIEARNLLSNPYVEQDVGRMDRLSLTTLRRLLEDFEAAPPSAFLSHIVRFYVVLLHFEVVRERSLQAKDGRCRYIFTVGENGLERVGPKGQIPGVGLGLARMRLRQALILLSECGYVESIAGGKAFVLTDAGRERLACSAIEVKFQGEASQKNGRRGQNN